MQQTNECEENPCQHNGKCTDLKNDYQCQCEKGFEGKDCEKVNCVWSEWEWDVTKCSKSCGDGERVKIRKKLVQEKNGGSCNGSATEYTFCNIKPCPVNCEWSEWVGGKCSAFCGKGTRKKEREITIEEKHGGVCDGNPTKYEECIVKPCPDPPQSPGCWILLPSGCPHWNDDIPSEPAIWFEEKIIDKYKLLGKDSCTKCTELDCRFATVIYDANCPKSRVHFVKDPCRKDPYPCLNGGKCNPIGTTFSCDCPDGVFGARCELDPCSKNPCLNDGKCTLKGTSFKCTCLPNTDGEKCENVLCPKSEDCIPGVFCYSSNIHHPLCVQDPCGGCIFGKCMEKNSDYHCECSQMPLAHGDHCEFCVACD